MTVKLTFEGDSIDEVISLMQDYLDMVGLLPAEPPPVGDEDDKEDDKVLPFGDYGPPKWAVGATGLILAKVEKICWPRQLSNLNKTKLPVFKNPPTGERAILNPADPDRDEVWIYNKRFTGDKNSGDTNTWVETAEPRGALNITEIAKADRKRV